MKIRIEERRPLPRRNNVFLCWGRRLLFLIGALAVGYVSFAFVDARLYQAAQARRFQQELDSLRASAGSEPTPRSPLLPPAANHARADIPGISGRGDSSLGRIEIKTIGLAAMILEGTDGRTLRHAVGHIPGTPLPGQQGNVALTGHRDTFFRPLHNVHRDDEITLTTLAGIYRYRVDSTRVVEPEDTEVLADSSDAVLTLVTCYPFYYVGPAPRRFVVRASLIH